MSSEVHGDAANSSPIEDLHDDSLDAIAIDLAICDLHLHVAICFTLAWR